VRLSEDGEMATIFAIPTTAPQDARTADLLERLREDVIPEATAGTPLKVYVGGNTAGFVDITDKVAARLPVFISVVIGLSVLLLVAAFRSLWIPLISAVLNLLSVAAAYGVVVAVFQEGIGASLIGADSGVPIISFLPVMLFAILFGLSMDYNVFLLSRIHEAYNEGDGPRESVIHGIGRIGKVVVFAGLIMAGVFLSFVSQPDVIGKMFGLGLAWRSSSTCSSSAWSSRRRSSRCSEIVLGGYPAGSTACFQCLPRRAPGSPGRDGDRA
jgi:RND superfamily putative drug exporter